jgi:hypothetical protein
MNSVKRITESLLQTGREVGLEVNKEETRHMVVSRHQNLGQNYNLLTANKSFENVTKFKYLGKTVSHQNCNQEVIKIRLNSGKACYHYVQNLTSSGVILKT